MQRTLIFTSFIFIFFCADGFASNLEKRMLDKWQRYERLSEDLEAALLIAEGVSDRNQINRFGHKLRAIYKDLDSRNIRRLSSPLAKGELIYKHLHNKSLTKYTAQAQLKNIFQSGTYNCVTATALYFVIARHYNLPVTLYTSPRHVYCVINYKRKTIRVEMTDPVNGFNFQQDQQSLIDYLLKFDLITRTDLKKRGAQAIYEDALKSTRRITPEQLVSVVYNNVGVGQVQSANYRQAMDTFQKAMIFDPQTIIYKDIYQSSFTQVALKLAKQNKYQELTGLLKRLLSFSHDAEFVNTYVMPVIGNISNYFSVDKNDPDKAKSFLQDMRPFLAGYPTALSRLTELESHLNFNQAVDLFNQNDYAAAYREMSELYRQAPTEDHVQRGYISAASQYAVFLADQRDFMAAGRVLDAVSAHFPRDKSVSDAARYVALTHIQELEQSGDYLDAWQMAGELRDQYPQDTDIIDAYQHTGCNYAIQAAQGRQWTTASSTLATLIEQFPANSLIKGTYIQVTLYILSETGRIQTDPEQARRDILGLYRIDAADPYLLDPTVAVYRELARIQLNRKTKQGLEAARSILLEGLTYQPTSAVLKEDVHRIEQELRE